MAAYYSLRLRRIRQSTSLVFVLNLFAATLCQLAPPSKADSQLATNFKTERTSISSSTSTMTVEPAAYPSPTPTLFTIAPSSGVQGKEYEVVVNNVDCLNGPTDDKKKQVSELRLYAPVGSGLTVVNMSQNECRISGKVTIAPDAPLNNQQLWLTDKDAKPPKPDFVLDFIVTGVTAQPIPPGLNNQGQVDVMWSVVPDKIANHNFGRGVQKHFYCIEVVIGNDSGYDLQLSSVGFTLPALKGNYRIPNSGYRTVRGSLEAFGEVAPRKFVVNGLKMLGPILTGFLPFFHSINHTANFSSAINVISNPIEKGLENVWPDLLPTQLDRLADQTYRDDVSTKTIIPNNVQARILTFIPKRLVCPDLKTCPSSDANAKLDAKNVQDVMRALGEIVIVGQQIVHVNRVRVVNTPFGTSITDHSISGRITDACNQGVGGVTITLSAGAGFLDRTVATSDDGSYTFPNVPDGRTYTVTPSSGSIKFRPSSSSPFLLNDTKTDLDFATDHIVITGKVTKNDGQGVVGLKLGLTGTGVMIAPTETKEGGTYIFEVLAPGAKKFKIKPEASKAYTFEPSDITWTCDQRDADFVATPTPNPSPTP